MFVIQGVFVKLCCIAFILCDQAGYFYSQKPTNKQTSHEDISWYPKMKITSLHIQKEKKNKGGGVFLQKFLTELVWENGHLV